jgi:hypothetical protein
LGLLGGGGGWGAEMTQALYAHMNNKKIKIKKNNSYIKESAGINVM